MSEEEKESADYAAAERNRSENMNLAAVNTSVFAFIGDAVYEMYVRRHVFEKGLVRADKLSCEAVNYVRAEAQAKILDVLMPELSEEEAAVARRGKNHKITSMPHNVSPKIYKKATAFETLIGYLDIKNDKERMEFLIKRAFEIVETEEIKIVRR